MARDVIKVNGIFDLIWLIIVIKRYFILKLPLISGIFSLFLMNVCEKF